MGKSAIFMLHIFMISESIVASQLEDLLLREVDRAGISPSWRITDPSVHC